MKQKTVDWEIKNRKISQIYRERESAKLRQGKAPQIIQ
jgi:hypothetical protein